MNLSRRSIVELALAAPLIGLAGPALARTSLPTDRWGPQALLRFWRGPAPALGTDPSETAPGWFTTTPGLNVHQPSNGPRIAPAEAELLKRRLDVAFAALMAQPSLKDIRGASVEAVVNVARVSTEDGVRLIHAVLSLNAKTIVWDDPRMVQRDGRYLTPWQEGAVLRLFLNPYQFVAGRDVAAEAVTGRIVHVRTGSAYGMIVSDQPPPREWNARSEAARLQHDRSWYGAGAAGSHPMLVHASSYRQQNEDLSTGKLKPTSGYARLVAAMFMVDWEAVHRSMIAQS